MDSPATSQSSMHASDPLLSFPDIVKWTIWGTVFQVAMVVGGHVNEFVKNNVFAIGGMAISLIFGALFARAAARSKGGALLGGSIVGGVCALIGIAVSVVLGDTPATILAFGTVGSAVAGLIGGIVLYSLAGSSRR